MPRSRHLWTSGNNARGSLAASKLFESLVTTPTGLDKRWYISRWKDDNGNELPDDPTIDTYVQLLAGD